MRAPFAREESEGAVEVRFVPDVDVPVEGAAVRAEERPERRGDRRHEVEVGDGERAADSRALAARLLERRALRQAVMPGLAQVTSTSVGQRRHALPRAFMRTPTP